MKNNFGLTPDDLEKILAIFARHTGIEEVVLYGSRAKGTYRPGSDIDLTLKGPELNLRYIE